MEIATSQSLSRVWRLALVGAATAFAWIVLSLLLGLGSGNAHAAESDDDGGLLGAVTSVVDRTASTVTGTVTTVTDTVSEVVDTVVDVAPAPVKQPVKQVVATVDTVVTSTTKPLTDVVSGGVVGTVTQPIVEVVTQVPIVGDVVSGSGLDEAITDLGGTVDETLGGIVGAVTDTVSGIDQPGTTPIPGVETPTIPPLVPGVDVPGLPELPRTLNPIDTTVVVAVPAAAAPLGDLSHIDGFAAVPLLSANSAVVSSTSTPSDARGGPLSAGGLCPSAVSSSGPGGTGSGAWALIALGPLVALRAWVRRAGPEDEHAPPAPAGSTDVSPD